MNKPSDKDQGFETLDHYRIIKELGRGAFGIVKLGVNFQNGKLFALKLLKVPALWDKFKAEYDTLERVSHEHIVCVFDIKQEGVYTKKNGQKLTVGYFVMKYVPHGEMFNIIYQKKAFSENLSRFYFKQLIDTIQYLHSQNIYHRDLKPENLLLDENYQLVLTDFGYAKHQEEPSITKTRLGTPGYVAPEILMGKPYDPIKADIFSAGVTLFVLYSRNVPFKEASLTDRAYRTLFDNPSFMFGYYQQHCEKVYTDSLKNLLLNILCFNPESRLSTEQIKAHDWVAQPINEANAHLEIQGLLGITPTFEISSSQRHLIVNELAVFRSGSREQSPLIMEELQKNLENVHVEQLNDLPSGCEFDFKLKCKDHTQLLKCLMKAVKELGGSLSENGENELVAKLISRADFENLTVDLKLYSTDSGVYCGDIIRHQGTYFGFMSVKDDLIKKLQEVTKRYSE